MANIDIIQNDPPAAERGLLESVNKTLERMKVSMRIKRLTEAVPGCEALQGKKILMVDDMETILADFVSALTTATGGRASFLQYQGQLVDELVAAIVASGPDVVLMDYNLSAGLKGDSVITKIRDINPRIICIGFSSEKEALGPFTRAGAKGVAKKEAYDAEESLRRVAGILSAS